MGKAALPTETGLAELQECAMGAHKAAPIRREKSLCTRAPVHTRTPARRQRQKHE